MAKSSIEKGAGFFMGFITTLMNVARQKVVPFEAIYRLGTEGGYATVAKIVDVAYTDWQAEQSKPAPQQSQGCHPISDARADGKALPPNHYRVRVTYEFPPIDALVKEYGRNATSEVLKNARFSLHSSCADMDRIPGERTFYVLDPLMLHGYTWSDGKCDEDVDLRTSEGWIAWGLAQRNATAPNGYRPATHEEVYEFSKARPEVWGNSLVGLGSFLRNEKDFMSLEVCSTSNDRGECRRWLSLTDTFTKVDEEVPLYDDPRGWPSWKRILFVCR